MKRPPECLGEARTICFAMVRSPGKVNDTSPRRTSPASSIRGLAIAHAPEGYFLFGCDADWRVVCDTWHESLDDAKAQAAFEYAGVSLEWSNE